MKSVGQNPLHIVGGMGQSLVDVLQEVIKYDLDGDSIEDILLFEYCYATQGTL